MWITEKIQEVKNVNGKTFVVFLQKFFSSDQERLLETEAKKVLIKEEGGLKATAYLDSVNECFAIQAGEQLITGIDANNAYNQFFK